MGRQISANHISFEAAQWPTEDCSYVGPLAGVKLVERDPDPVVKTFSQAFGHFS